MKNAGATNQRLVNRIFKDQIGRNMEVYIDNMVVKYRLAKSHLDDLHEVFQTLSLYNMKLN